MKEGIEMILGIGVDILEVGRIERALKQKGFKEKAFTDEEIACCEQKGAHSSESYAARFAAKEAFGKALGTGLQPGQLQQVEVLTDEKTGAPRLHVMGQLRVAALSRQVERIHVSLSHTAKNAIAQVVLEG